MYIFSHVITVHMYRPWFICGQSLSHQNDGEEKGKRKPYCIIYSTHICRDVRSVTSLIFLYLASITAWYTRNTTWTDSTRLSWETILTINRQ